MKRVVYRNLYKLLSALSRNINNPHLSRYKIAVGTTLLLLASGCQTAKKNSKNEGDKDTVYSDSAYLDSVQPQQGIDVDTIVIIKDTLVTTCYDMPEMCYTSFSIDTIPTDPNHIYLIAEEMPEFPGGGNALMNCIKKNIYFPEEYGDTCIKGRVIVEFVIEKDGSISDPQILRGIDQKLDEIALEVVHKLPNFKPATQNGEPVRVKYVVPVTF